MTDALRAAILAFVNTCGAMLIAFGVVLKPEQLAAVGAVVNAGLVVMSLMRHQKVSAQTKV